MDARWGATCQTNKKIVTLRADWTNQDPRSAAELAKYKRAAVPFNVVWLPGKPEPVILPEILTPGIVLDAVKPAGDALATGKAGALTKY